ncbi:hypothetical protein ACFL96_20360 [Thermoproteota archaeon]
MTDLEPEDQEIKEVLSGINRVIMNLEYLAENPLNMLWLSHTYHQIDFVIRCCGQVVSDLDSEEDIGIKDYMKKLQKIFYGITIQGLKIETTLYNDMMKGLEVIRDSIKGNSVDKEVVHNVDEMLSQYLG